MLEKHLLRRVEAIRQRQPIPLELALWDGGRHQLGESSRITLHLKTPRAIAPLLHPSLHALGRAYVEGLIDVEGPVDEAIMLAEQLARTAPGTSSLGSLPNWIARHTRHSDREAIAYHYDVSNEFYAQFLDPKLVYSCAYYRNGHEDLATAQTQKLEHICRKLALTPGQRLLDIGCGWGALAIHAARHHGVDVVGITLSRQQFDFARQRVREAGLSDHVEIRLEDYRDLAAREGFDRIASVGMFEHVGLKNLGAYFARVHALLRPGGIALNHGITSSDPDSRSVGLGAGEFIEQYVFPDGELPHVSLAIHELSAAGLELADAESLRLHYARTLAQWSAAFEAKLDTMRALAGERRARIWRMYLAGCAHAFARGWINLYQLLAFKPLTGQALSPSPLPLTRDYMYRDGWSVPRPNVG